MNMSKLVRVTMNGVAYVGEVVAVEGEHYDIVKVKIGNDVLKFYISSKCTLEKLNPIDAMAHVLESFMEENGIQWSGFSESDGVTYELEGWTYNVSVSFEWVEGEYLFYLETTHQERYSKYDDIEKASANAHYYKTLKAFKRNILKWVEA